MGLFEERDSIPQRLNRSWRSVMKQMASKHFSETSITIKSGWSLQIDEETFIPIQPGRAKIRVDPDDGFLITFKGFDLSGWDLVQDAIPSVRKFFLGSEETFLTPGLEKIERTKIIPGLWKIGSKGFLFSLTKKRTKATIPSDSTKKWMIGVGIELFTNSGHGPTRPIWLSVDKINEYPINLEKGSFIHFGFDSKVRLQPGKATLRVNRTTSGLEIVPKGQKPLSEEIIEIDPINGEPLSFNMKKIKLSTTISREDIDGFDPTKDNPSKTGRVFVGMTSIDVMDEEPIDSTVSESWEGNELMGLLVKMEPWGVDLEKFHSDEGWYDIFVWKGNKGQIAVFGKQDMVFPEKI